MRLSSSRGQAQCHAPGQYLDFPASVCRGAATGGLLPSSRIQCRAKSHLGKLPGAVPVNLSAFIASEELTHKHFAKILALAPQHKFFRVRFCRFEEIEFGI